jgi:antitoxin (DNA-binding transcriptional repressor) of toxin-antitoxin stability system
MPEWMAMLYNVHAMTHLKVAEARARFGEILDQAEKGMPVVIERRGVRFRVVAEPQARAAVPAAKVFSVIDPAVMAAQWSWTAGAKGLRFAPRRKRR